MSKDNQTKVMRLLPIKFKTKLHLLQKLYIKYKELRIEKKEAPYIAENYVYELKTNVI